MTALAALLLALALPGEELLLRFRAEAVDGVDELVLREGRASIEHREWDPIRDPRIEVLAAPPGKDARVEVRKREGRARVSVTQLPRADNGLELRVRIDDGPYPGAQALAFELWSVPVAPTPRPFDVLIVTIDSLRPDHLGCYGYDRATSPVLDAFAAGAVRHANAFSTSSFTPPAHASLLSSRQVGDHGLLSWNALPEGELLLPEILARHGYRTGASTNLTLLSENNLGQGVEWRREGDREARAIVDDALEFLRADDARPYFLWLHLYDVHRPYGRVPGWTARFAAAPRPGIGDGEQHYGLRPQDVAQQKLAHADLEYLVDRYDAGIAYADAQLGPLLAELGSPARRARTLVVVTADHGESLLERPERLFAHDPFLFADVGRVPLLVRYPEGKGAGSVRSEHASLIDVAPTVLALLGIPAPPCFAGISLFEPPASPAVREIYQECWGWERLASVRTPAWFVLRDLKLGKTSVYDLARDPDELHPLPPSDAPGASLLVERLERFARRRPAGEEPPPIDADLLRRLRALGYVDDR